MRPESTNSQQKGCNSEDRISKLPDEILAYILSTMTVREAVVTSVLAKRWRYSWISISNLNFDATETLYKIAASFYNKGKEYANWLNNERTMYVHWVNHVLRLHAAQNLYEFRVCFDLDERSKTDIDEWFKFALAKRVERLELDLSEGRGIIRDPHNCYNFSVCLLDQSVEQMIRDFHSSFVGFKTLKSLSLKSVNVNGTIVEYFLSHCPLLERLSLHGSANFGSLKVAGSALMLKYLDLYCLIGTEVIEICDTNIVSFAYTGESTTLLFKNVPLLVEVSIGGGIIEFMGLSYVFQQLSCCLAQLKVLTLGIDGTIHMFENLPEFPKLETLVLQLVAWKDDSLLIYTSLIKAAPYLHRFAVQLKWTIGMSNEGRRDISKSLKCSHQYLKVVELSGYCGRSSDLELATYFLEDAIALEQIVIDPHDQFFWRCPKANDEIEKEEAARSLALQQLVGKVPAGVKLVIL